MIRIAKPASLLLLALVLPIAGCDRNDEPAVQSNATTPQQGGTPGAQVEQDRRRTQ